MSDVEARLRRTLREGLDGVVADPGRAATTVRRARLGRALRGVAAGLAGVLLAGAVATAWEGGREDPPPPPAAEPEQIATFAVDFDPGTGTVTVDVPKAQICFDLSRDIRMHAQLRYDFAGAGDVGVVATGLSARPGVPQCRAVDPDHAERLLADPYDHLVVLGPGYLTRSAPLEPLATAPEDAPYVVKIVCSQDGAVALTPQAQPRRDGVHLQVHNQAGAWRVFNLTSPEGGGSSGSRLPRRRVFTDAGNIAPGAYSVGCFRDDSFPYDPSHPDYATFTIVDPNELWIDPELECDAGRRRAEVVTDERSRGYRDQPDFDALIREHVPGLLSDDVIVRATYPESAAKSEHRTIVRDGRKLATLYLGIEEDPDAPGKFVWSIMPRVCPGSGIAPE